MTESILKDLFEKAFQFDLENPDIKDTPKRMAKMFCNEMFASIDSEPPELTSFKNPGCNEMILLDNIPFCSTCEHHLVFFSGRAHFLYIPNELIVGASKIARLIDYFCKRPQIQERLTKNVLDYFCEKIKPKGAMLVMRGVHQCMSLRGVKTGPDAGMVTSALYGAFSENKATRDEAMGLINFAMLDKGKI